jgi:branched-chain amino acid transport system substrate-binding protein
MGTMALWDVIKRAGSMDSEKIVQAAIKTDIPGDKTLLRYGIKFFPPGSPYMGQNMLARYFVTQWQNGELVIVDPAGAASPGKSLIILK